MGFKGNNSKGFKKIAALQLMVFVLACLLSSCNITDSTADNTTDNPAEDETENTIANYTDYDSWIDSITDERGVYVGQDKEVTGYYKRIGIARIDGTYEDMLKARDMEKRGYLIVNDDGTAFFDLDGEKTEYAFDKGYFYLLDDTERANGFSYTCINTRLIINDGTTITQYLRLTDEELAAYRESAGKENE